MLNLLNFLWKNYAFFLFLLLESIALSMVVSSGHQGAVFAYTSNQMGGQAFSSWKSITHYFSLAEANEQLSAENIRLHHNLAQSYLDRNTSVFDSISMKNDSLETEETMDTLVQSFDYISAKVISNSIHKQKNYLMLNKGSKQGVQVNMGVLGPNGCVGIVYSVSNDFSTVISLLNTDTRISAKLLSNNELGSLIWNGNNPNLAQLSSIETYIPIHVGDTLISSGFSHIFPEGILLGTIKDYHKVAGENTYQITIKLSTRFSNLQYVSIIRNRFYEEQKLLEEQKEEQL
ncbi:MAG: rod shape-determining protein MreC [Bacteroidales bacterium]|nr:rod shape-determining protein MreC [Bacteroidales bacterium]